jgi:hypothetical protein
MQLINHFVLVLRQISGRLMRPHWQYTTVVGHNFCAKPLLLVELVLPVPFLNISMVIKQKYVI